MPRVENMLVFLPNWVGDVVMATPALRALRSLYGRSRITYAGGPAALETLAGAPWADALELDESGRKPRLWNLLRAARRFRKGRYDLAVLLPNSLRVALVARLAGIPFRAGYDRDGRGWLLNLRLQPQRERFRRFVPVPTLDYYLDLVRLLGARGELSRRMELPLAPEDARAADELLALAGADPHRPIVMVNPGAAFGTSKLWPADRYAAVCDALIERRKAQIIVNAAPSERPIAAKVVAAMHHPPLVSFAERANTLGMLKGLIRRCALLVTNDTGARHFAAAFGVGLVTVFGSTDPRWAQIDYPRERILRADVPCSPCQKKVCWLPPGPAVHQCMTAVSVDQVLAAAEEVLASAGRPGGEP